MPKVDRKLIAKKKEIVSALKKIVKPPKTDTRIAPTSGT